MTDLNTQHRHRRFRRLLPMALLCLGLLSCSARAEKLPVLFVTGHDPHGHSWQETTPILANTLKRTGRFEVDIAHVSTAGQAADFAPDFARYDAVVMYAHGLDWEPSTFDAFEKYMRDGGNCVVVHNAVGQFPAWRPYRSIIGIGPGDMHYGVRLRFDEEKGEIVRDSAGAGWPRNGHGVKHEWVVAVRDAEHPITAGLPRAWMHAEDELYHGFRAKPEHVKHLKVLATAFSAKSTRGTGAHEPVIMVNQFGKGRVFHTTLGHGVPAVSCVGFRTVFLRGVEWAASGRVTLTEIPDDLPKPDRSSTTKESSQ